MLPRVTAVILAVCGSSTLPPRQDPGPALASIPAIPHIQFDMPVTPVSVTMFMDAMDKAEKEPSNFILVEIDSPGGYVRAGMKMSKRIEESKKTVVCVVDGMAASMALYILQSCDLRAMTARSQLMAHEPSVGGVEGQPDELEQTVESLRVLSRAMAHHIAHRTAISTDEYLAQVAHGREWYMGFEEASRLQFVDIVPPSVSAMAEILLSIR